MRLRPGSPWMPTPISISSSARSKVGLPAAGTVHEVSAMPIERTLSWTFWQSAVTVCEVGARLGGRADDLLREDRATDAAAAGRVQRVLHRDVVGDDDGRDLNPLGSRPSRLRSRSS